MNNEYLHSEDDSEYISNIEGLDIDINQDIKSNIKDFDFSKDDLNKIDIPSEVDNILNDILIENKKQKRKAIINHIIDILLIFILIMPFVGIYNPNVFKPIDKAYPVFVKLNSFFQKENMYRLLGLNESNEVELNTGKEVFIKSSDVKEVKSESQELDLIHNLANNIIKAEYKWKCVEVTPETIQKALDGVDYISDTYDRVYFRSNLNKWKSGDFSNGVEVHNRVWSILDGNVGEAYELDEKEIKKILDKYY